MTWTTSSRRIDKFEWHRWFAWYPVRLGQRTEVRWTPRGDIQHTTKEWAWLCYVDRCGLMMHTYRAHKGPDGA